VKAKVAAGTEVTISETTNYPFEEQIHIRINTPADVDFPLYVRIPEWCKDGHILINGRQAGARLNAGTYARISRTWKDGDELTVDFPMKITVRQGAVNQNSVSVNYGPLTFSLKIDEKYEKRDSKETAISASRWPAGVDASKWPSWEIHPDSPWNYALQCDVEHPEQSFSVVRKTWPADNFPFTVESVPLEITAKGSKIPSWTTDKFGLCAVLPDYPARTTGQSENITLIPMGAARLRISAFPHLTHQH
jgi:hypothetical protein